MFNKVLLEKYNNLNKKSTKPFQKVEQLIIIYTLKNPNILPQGKHLKI